MEIRAQCLNTPDVLLCPLQQSHAYGRVMEWLGRDVQAFCCHDTQAHVIGQAQIITRRFGPFALSWLPRGPVWAELANDAGKLGFLTAIQKETRAATLIHTYPKAMPGSLPIITPQHMAELSLDPDVDAMLAGQHVKWRNRLRHARKSGVQIRHHPYQPKRDAPLLAHEAQQRRTRHYRGLPSIFLTAWQACNPGQARLFTAYWQGQPCAFMLMLLHGQVATYHSGWINADGRAVSAHNMTLWHAAEWLAIHGYHRLDLGCVDTEAAPGLARFKIGSGARVVSTGSTWLCLRKPQLRHRNAA